MSVVKDSVFGNWCIPLDRLACSAPVELGFAVSNTVKKSFALFLRKLTPFSAKEYGNDTRSMMICWLLGLA